MEAIYGTYIPSYKYVYVSFIHQQINILSISFLPYCMKIVGIPKIYFKDLIYTVFIRELSGKQWKRVESVEKRIVWRATMGED